jgi:hypothetical protein
LGAHHAGDDLLITLLNSPAGESEESGPVPLTPDDLERLRQSIDPTSAQFDPSGRELERLGEALYRGVFTASIKTMLLLSLERLPPEIGFAYPHPDGRCYRTTGSAMGSHVLR